MEKVVKTLYVFLNNETSYWNCENLKHLDLEQ